MGGNVSQRCVGSPILVLRRTARHDNAWARYDVHVMVFFEQHGLPKSTREERRAMIFHGLRTVINDLDAHRSQPPRVLSAIL